MIEALKINCGKQLLPLFVADARSHFFSNLCGRVPRLKPDILEADEDMGGVGIACAVGRHK